MPLKALLLGGTPQARALAEMFAGERGFEIVSSLAGRIQEPRVPEGEVRIGGFGGADGLERWLAANDIDVIVDASHPFAARITANAVAAAQKREVPILIVRRAPWTAVTGDRWIQADSLQAAAAAVPGLGARVFLTIGRQGVAEFAHLDSTWFLIRSIDPPTATMPANHELILERGPFSLEHEANLLEGHRIDVLVTKNSGGDQTAAKLTAARFAGLPVVMIDRPPLPAGVEAVDSVALAADWLRRQVGESETGTK